MNGEHGVADARSARRGVRSWIAVLAMAVLVAFGGYAGIHGVVAQDATPDTYTKMAHRVVLGSSVPDGADGYDLVLATVMIEPGVALAAHTHPGTQIAHIEQGELTYTVLTGEIELHRAPAEGETEGEVIMIQAGETYVLMPGDTVIEQPGNAHQATNNGTVDVEILLSSLFPEGAAPAEDYVATPTA